MNKEMPDSYTVRLVQMPLNVEGAMCESPDGHVNIYINNKLSNASQKEALDHEFDHWRRDDLHSADDIRAIESRRPERHLPPLVLARDLPPAKRRKRGRAAHVETVPPHDDLRDDVYLRLPYYD